MITTVVLWLVCAFAAGYWARWLQEKARESIDRRVAYEGGLEKVVVYRPVREAEHRPPPPD